MLCWRLGLKDQDRQRWYCLQMRVGVNNSGVELFYEGESMYLFASTRRSPKLSIVRVSCNKDEYLSWPKGSKSTTYRYRRHYQAGRIQSNKSASRHLCARERLGRRSIAAIVSGIHVWARARELLRALHRRRRVQQYRSSLCQL